MSYGSNSVSGNAAFNPAVMKASLGVVTGSGAGAGVGTGGGTGSRKWSLNLDLRFSVLPY